MPAESKTQTALRELRPFLRKGTDPEQFGTALARFIRAFQNEKASQGATAVEYDGERTIKAFGQVWKLPIPIHRGVFNHGAHYDEHDRVTYGGSEWHCKKTATTRRPGDGNADWLLVVKAGRDGRDAGVRR